MAVPDTKIFTSSFFHTQAITGDIERVAISHGVPRWFKGPQDLQLAPSRGMLKDTKTQEHYEEWFMSYIRTVNAEEVLRRYAGRRIVWLCWEPPLTKCHRRMVAEYIEEQTGYGIPEWNHPDIAPYLELPLKSELKAQEKRAKEGGEQTELF